MLKNCLTCIAILLLSIGAASAQQFDNQSCHKCHAQERIANRRPQALAAMVRIAPDESPVYRDEEDVEKLFVPEQEYEDSVHGGINCVDCHRGVERLPHKQRLAALSCSDCHPGVEETVQSGPHGAPEDGNGKKRPSCADCHGDPHQVPAVTGSRDFSSAIQTVSACQKCHDTEDHYDFNPVSTYRENVHGEALFVNGLPMTAVCTDCHGNHAVLPPENPESPLHADQVPETCGSCHQGIKERYVESVHGQHLLDGDEDAATCTSCHHSHGIEEVGEPFLLHVVEECSTCHIDLGETYMTSYHGKAAHLGYGEVAVCSSCHGAHDILPASNPESHVAEENLVETCGKCHDDANENFTQYVAHVDYMDREEHPQVFWTFVVMTSLLLGTLAVFIPHTMLWFQRTLIGRLKNPKGPHGHAGKDRLIKRFDWVHRVTHGLIVISFMGLVITGFPLKYSHTQWAEQATHLFGGIHAMGLLHRGFAIITFAYVAVHVVFLIKYFWKDCPRPRWRYLFGPDSMVFSLRDLKDFIAMVRWFFWLGPRPKFDRWTYFEKFDYWGEIWGVIIIGGSGLLLWFPEFFTRWLPGWVLNCAMVVHSIEALLAASVIFLVHFFNTHLRPEKFPIDTVMFTGSMPESEMIEERGKEYERLKEEGRLEERVVEPMALHWRVVGVILGMFAFLLGIFLIVLAIKTELSQFFG